MIADGTVDKTIGQGVTETDKQLVSSSLSPCSAAPSYCFSKTERLCSKTLFEELIKSGYSFVKYPFRIVTKKSTEQNEFPARIAISVSKKKFKRAVKRNHIKRLTREAYRLNKATLYENIKDDYSIDILFIYLDNTIPDYSKVEKAMKIALRKIGEHFNASNEKISIDEQSV